MDNVYRSSVVALNFEIERDGRTKLVLFLRKFFVGLIILFIAALVIYSTFRLPNINIDGVNFDNVSISDGIIRMQNPKINGFDQKKRPYVLQAAEATQNLLNQGEVHLSQIRGEMELDKNDRVTLDAKAGVFETEKDFLKLEGPINVYLSNGDNAELSSAEVDFKKGSIISNESIKINMGKLGVLTSDKMIVSDDGQHLQFIGGVKLDQTQMKLKKDLDKQ